MAPTGVGVVFRGEVRGDRDGPRSTRQATVSHAGAIRCATDPATRRVTGIKYESRAARARYRAGSLVCVAWFFHL